VEQQPLNVPAFYNAHELKLDAKHRLFIPADVRRLIDPAVHGTAFFVILGSNRKPWLYPEKYYQSQASRMPKAMTPNKDLLAYAQFKFALAQRVEWDEQGRVVMPENLLRRAQIQNEVTLAGVWDHLELWNRADWDRHSDELVENSEAIEDKGNEALEAAFKKLAERSGLGQE
jgi:MraZ protein